MPQQLGDHYCCCIHVRALRYYIKVRYLFLLFFIFFTIFSFFLVANLQRIRKCVSPKNRNIASIAGFNASEIYNKSTKIEICQLLLLDDGKKKKNTTEILHIFVCQRISMNSHVRTSTYNHTNKPSFVEF